MVVLVSLEARQKPFIAFCSDVISVQTPWQLYASCLGSVVKAANLRHHDVLYLTVGRGCQSHFRVLNQLCAPVLCAPPTGREIKKRYGGTSGDKVFATGCA